MIQKELLMLGDIVLYQGILCEIIILSENGSVGIMDKCGVNTIVADKDLDPVPLTEDVLTKIGFPVDTRRLLGGFICRPKKIDFHDVLISNGIGYSGVCISIYEERKQNIYQEQKHVSSLHELQNAITESTHKPFAVDLKTI